MFPIPRDKIQPDVQNPTLLFQVSTAVDTKTFQGIIVGQNISRRTRERFGVLGRLQ